MSTKHRAQNLQPVTGRKHIYIAVLCVVALLTLAILFFIIGKTKKYSPPEYDKHAVTGVPTPDKGFLYDTIPSNYEYQFSIAANLYQQEDASVKVYFTNPDSNDVLLMCEIEREKDGKVLYKSGVIRPDEYIESISPNGHFPNEATNIIVTIYAFEPDTWYSAGSTTFSTILQAW